MGSATDSTGVTTTTSTGSNTIQSHHDQHECDTEQLGVQKHEQHSKLSELERSRGRLAQRFSELERSGVRQLVE